MSAPIYNWPALSFLEGLRPGPEEKVELAFLAAYSADLGSIGAALLALAGKDNDAGRGSPSDFADTVEMLRGKTRIVIQRGRLAKMRRTPKVAAVLDQFVREVDLDEATGSWHPKAALIKLRAGDGTAIWRLWIGSRNLTECVNRDIGLLLVSAAKGGSRIEGVEHVALALAEKAALKGVRAPALATEVRSLSWRSPVGVKVQGIRWTTGSGDFAVPAPPPGTDTVVIVSPFIDKAFLARQRTHESGGARRILLTTMREIERVGPALSGFDDLLALDAPDYPTPDPSDDINDHSSNEVSQTSNEEEEIGRGLHAKLLFVRTGQKRRLWLGSANATMRAWTGRNVEVMAELLISEAVEKGLFSLLDAARIIPTPIEEYEPDDSALEEEALERARSQVAARWSGELTVEGNGLRLMHLVSSEFSGPHPDDADIVLEVGALNGPLLPWPRHECSVGLGDVLRDERSEFVRLRVSRADKGLSWLQRAPAQPPFGEERDRAAFARFLGARGFLLWLASMLSDSSADGDKDWTQEDRIETSRSDINLATDPDLPTLEEMLSAWARNPQKFADINRRVSTYLPAVLEQVEREDPNAAKQIRVFSELWRTVQAGLGQASVRRRGH